jgi:ATP synthase protein I
MSEDPPSDPLARLSEKIDRAQSGRAPVNHVGGGADVQHGMALGFRIGIELVAAIVVSTGLGWAFDRWLGTRPWGIIVMFFLGVAAGMLNVYRAITGTGMAVGYRRNSGDAPGSRRKGDPWDDEEC